jgi:hypothetical protein
MSTEVTFITIFWYTLLFCGARGSAVVWGAALQVGRSRVHFPMVSLEVFIDIILLAALWPWVELAYNRYEYQGYFMGGKGGRFVGLTTLPPSCADCLEIWEPQPPATSRARPGLYKYCFNSYLCITLLFTFYAHFSSTFEWTKFLPRPTF